MLGGMNIQPEQHRYPFLASLLCIPSQDAIIENEGAAGPEDDDGRRMREARGLARMSDDAIAATAAALAARLPPEGWRVATDAESGRDYLYNHSGEVRWTDNAPVVPDSEDTQRELLRRALDGDFGQLLAKQSAPFFDGFFQDAQACPAVSKEGWPDVINRFVKRLPVLVERSRNVAGADARAALVDAVAEPCFYLAAQRSAHAAFSSEIDPAAAFSKADHVAELPAEYRCAIEGFRAALFDRLTEALTDDRRRQALRRALQIIPRRSILALATVRALPSSHATCTSLVKLFAEKGLTGMSVLQRLAAAGLGARDARTERDACLAKAQPAGNCTAGLSLKLELADLSDADLEVVVEELADSTSKRFSTLKGTARDALTRALDLETYARRCDRLVSAYGDDAYVDLVVSLYPALVAPLSYALQSSELNGAQVADHLFWATSRVLDVFEGSLPLTQKLRVLDDELRGVLGCIMGLAHRTSLQHAPRVRRLCAWAADCAAAWRPPLAHDKEPFPAYAARAADAWTARAAARARAKDRRELPHRAPNVDEASPLAYIRWANGPEATEQLARLGFVRVNASSGVWAAGDGEDVVSHCRIVFGDDAAASTVDEGWLRAAVLPQGGIASLSGEPRAHLLYRRGPREGKAVTLAGLRRLLARAGYD
ncbi:unnamed protein product [Pelagomonas calceolata]|uniref:WW domain-containing protein n=1 Tax=Pelagomonas calceolata TaxID=35677 RepID=A0A7S3ZZG8_9STRA|nr:unnamed protein product [Pelagomonas calceolata]